MHKPPACDSAAEQHPTCTSYRIVYYCRHIHIAGVIGVFLFIFIKQIVKKCSYIHFVDMERGGGTESESESTLHLEFEQRSRSRLETH